MFYSIRVFTESSGYQSTILVDESSFPVYWPTLYTSSVLRSKQLQWETIKKHLEAIRILLMWADLKKNDLELTVRSGEKFTNSELDQITTLCQKKLNDSSIESTSNKVVNLKSHRRNLERDLWQQIDSQPNQVSSKTFNNRLRYISEYIEWMGYIFSDHPLNNATKSDITSNTSDAAKLLLMRKVTEPNRRFEDVKSLSTSEIKSVLEIINPTNPLNPFENIATKIRNYAIIAIMIETGIRSGELLTITMNNVIRSSKGSNGLKIRRMQGVKKDSRTKKRGTKGRERDVPISKATAELLDLYVEKYRGTVDSKIDLNWLFLSHSNQNMGKPLSRLDGITSKIETATGIKITPHKLRHTAAWQFCLRYKKANKEWKEVETKLVYQFGWSGSDSPEVIHYAKQYIKDELFSKSINQQNMIAEFIFNAMSSMENEIQ